MSFSLRCVCVCVNQGIPTQLYQVPPNMVSQMYPHPSFTTQKTRTFCILTFEGLWGVTGEAHGPTSQPYLCPKDLQGWQRLEKRPLCDRQKTIRKVELRRNSDCSETGSGGLKPKTNMKSQRNKMKLKQKGKEKRGLENQKELRH